MGAERDSALSRYSAHERPRRVGAGVLASKVDGPGFRQKWADRLRTASHDKRSEGGHTFTSHAKTSPNRRTLTGGNGRKGSPRRTWVNPRQHVPEAGVHGRSRDRLNCLPATVARPGWLCIFRLGRYQRPGGSRTSCQTARGVVVRHFGRFYQANKVDVLGCLQRPQNYLQYAGGSRSPLRRRSFESLSAGRRWQGGDGSCDDLGWVEERRLETTRTTFAVWPQTPAHKFSRRRYLRTLSAFLSILLSSAFDIRPAFAA